MIRSVPAPATRASSSSAGRWRLPTSTLPGPSAGTTEHERLDLDKFKSPSLRGLAARAPYFHNGIAPTLKDVVIHYEVARGFQFTRQEREDLVAFLGAL
jgi:cytochrome c peroxidase